jgi:hypothetical protein
VQNQIVFLSSPSGYVVWEFTTYDPNDNDLIFIQNAGCILIHNTPVYNNSLLPDFPKWIQYTYKPNHWETKLLSKDQKQAAWEAQENQFRMLDGSDQTD